MTFQEKAWSDEKVMQKPACDGNMLLVIDVHKAQKTPDISQRFEQSNTNVVYIPPGTTSLIQPLDVLLWLFMGARTLKSTSGSLVLTMLKIQRMKPPPIKIHLKIQWMKCPQM